MRIIDIIELDKIQRRSTEIFKCILNTKDRLKLFCDGYIVKLCYDLEQSQVLFVFKDECYEIDGGYFGDKKLHYFVGNKLDRYKLAPMYIDNVQICNISHISESSFNDYIRGKRDFHNTHYTIHEANKVRKYELKQLYEWKRTKIYRDIKDYLKKLFHFS